MAESCASRIYKKSSSNQKVTTYLGKRDYVDHITHTESIDGVVLLDPQYVANKKVFVKLVCAFRYGREDLDVLGLKFRKDLVSSKIQIYPKLSEDDPAHTELHTQLIKKLGEHAYPFLVEIPNDSPCSVNLQPAENDKDKSCGIDYRLITYVVEDGDEDKIHKKSSVQLVIRKVQYAPDKNGPQPSAEVQKEFLMSDKPLSLEISLDKDLYYHGEPISVNVQVTNNSSKSVKKIRISARQVTDIYLFTSNQYKCQVAEIEADDQVAASSTLCKVYNICPLLANNKDKCGLALDGKLKHEDTNLASSTIIKEGVEKENLGIVVQYTIKVRLIMSGLASEVSAEVPLQLMHSKPSA